MPDPKVGASVLYTDAKNDPPQHAVITAVGVDDDRDEDNPGKVTDCWLTVFPAGAPPVAGTQPVSYDPAGASGTWRWETDAKSRTSKAAGA